MVTVRVVLAPSVRNLPPVSTKTLTHVDKVYLSQSTSLVIKTSRTSVYLSVIGNVENPRGRGRLEVREMEGSHRWIKVLTLPPICSRCELLWRGLVLLCKTLVWNKGPPELLPLTPRDILTASGVQPLRTKKRGCVQCVVRTQVVKRFSFRLQPTTSYVRSDFGRCDVRWFTDTTLGIEETSVQRSDCSKVPFGFYLSPYTSFSGLSDFSNSKSSFVVVASLTKRCSFPRAPLC